MRGALSDVLAGRLGQGIIPAYAGSTWSPGAPSALLWDHPRVCGEHTPFLNGVTTC